MWNIGSRSPYCDVVSKAYILDQKVGLGMSAMKQLNSEGDNLDP